MSETAPTHDLSHLLEQALAEEDVRLDALEARLSQLQPVRRERREPDSEPEPEPEATSPPPELGEARRLLAESGSFLRELQGRLEVLESEGIPEPVAALAEPAPLPEVPAPLPLPEQTLPISEWLEETPPTVSPSVAASRPASAHDLGTVFGAQASEPAWVQRVLAGQQQVLAVLERLERVATRTMSALDGWPADPSLVARAEHAERALAEAQLEMSGRTQRLNALESQLDRSQTQTPRAPCGPVQDPAIAQLVDLLRNPKQFQAAEELRSALASQPTPQAEAAPAVLQSLREELLEMSGEHQALVEAHARLLDRMLGVFEDVS